MGLLNTAKLSKEIFPAKNPFGDQRPSNDTYKYTHLGHLPMCKRIDFEALFSALLAAASLPSSHDTDPQSSEDHFRQPQERRGLPENHQSQRDSAETG